MRPREEDMQRGMREIGDVGDGMDLSTDPSSAEARRELYLRGIRHLLSYVQAYRVHRSLNASCRTDALCPGVPVLTTISLRREMEPGYAGRTLNAAIVAIHERMQENELLLRRAAEATERAARAETLTSALHVELADSNAALERCLRELAEARAALKACDEILGGDARALLPNSEAS